MIMYPFTDCCPNLPGADPGCDDGWCCTHEMYHGEPEDEDDEEEGES